MIPDKQENCPDCGKELSQNEYDGQYCDTCKTRPFAFIKDSNDTDLDKIIFRVSFDIFPHYMDQNQRERLKESLKMFAREIIRLSIEP
ncbi:MAG: hypothetical protein IAE63_04145 [Alphaproteobacteria bacterium]|nr:hypothetical protein [Alphaproteobacteria bacterium]